jgi:translation initiation factor 1
VSKRGKISTDGGDDFGQNPFGSLSGAELPAFSEPVADNSASTPSHMSRAEKPKNRGRVDIKRSTARRGGKTVTVVSGFTGIGLAEKEKLAKKMRNVCGCGGTVKDGQIEIQGDKREPIASILTDAGFRPVMAGG